MGLDFFRRSVELAESYLQPGQRAAYTIQTNENSRTWDAFSDPLRPPTPLRLLAVSLDRERSSGVHSARLGERLAISAELPYSARTLPTTLPTPADVAFLENERSAFARLS
jgi:hypothetical protein